MNCDEETGIFYGAISQNSLNSYALDDIYSLGEDRVYEQAKEELRYSLIGWMEENNLLPYSEKSREMDINTVFDVVEDLFNERYENDYKKMRFEGDGYIIETMLDNDLCIIKSPYVTFAPPCSPCVPGAGNLDSIKADIELALPSKNSLVEINRVIRQGYGDPSWRITYCLGPDWFDDEKCPYPYTTYDQYGNLGEWVLPNGKDENE